MFVWQVWSRNLTDSWTWRPEECVLSGNSHCTRHLVIVRSGVPLVGDPVWLTIHRCYWFTKTKTHLGASGHSWPVRLPSANRTLPVYVTENCWPVCCWVNPHFMSPHMLMVVREWSALAYHSDHLTIEGIALGFDTSCLKDAVGVSLNFLASRKRWPCFQWDYLVFLWFNVLSHIHYQPLTIECITSRFYTSCLQSVLVGHWDS